MSDDDILVGSIDELMAAAAGDRVTTKRLVARSQRLIERWIQEGLVVDAIGASYRRGEPIERVPADEVVSITVGNHRYFLACVLELPPLAVAQVNRALRCRPAARFLWWRRTHGALGGKTIAEAIGEGRVKRCVELAVGYSEDQGDAEDRAECE